MKIIVERENLAPALAGIGSVIERRQTLPILSNLLIETEEDQFVITATDLEMQISTRLAGTVDVAGSITLPAKKLIDICRLLPDQSTVTIEVEKERARVVSGRSRFMLGTLPSNGYPSLEGEDTEHVFDIPASAFRRMVEKTCFAMAQQDVRFFLNGLMLELREGLLVAVATDGHRLAKAEFAFPDIGTGVQRQIIIPTKSVLEIKRLLSTNGPENVTLEIGQRTILIRYGDWTFRSKLIDGRYPDYMRVIPKGLSNVALIDRQSLRSALSRTSVVSYEKLKGVRMTFDQGLLKLEVTNLEQEEGMEELEIEYSGESTMIGFNVGYWLDVLDALDSKMVEARFMDADVSAVLRDPDSDAELYVVMPMKI